MVTLLSALSNQAHGEQRQGSVSDPPSFSLFPLLRGFWSRQLSEFSLSLSGEVQRGRDVRESGAGKWRPDRAVSAPRLPAPPSSHAGLCWLQEPRVSCPGPDVAQALATVLSIRVLGSGAPERTAGLAARFFGPRLQPRVSRHLRREKETERDR